MTDPVHPSVICGYCKCLVPLGFVQDHLRWHDELEFGGREVDADLEAERVTHDHETHREVLKRVRKERIEPSWKGKS